MRAILAIAALPTLLLAAAPAPPATGPAASQPSPIAPGATPQKIAGSFSFTEGPAADAHGILFFTDQPNDTIYRFDADAGTLSTFLKPAGRANGLCFDGPNLIACADENNQLWSIDPNGKVTVLIRDFGGKLLNGPNDIWVRPDQPPGSAGIYITDPLYKRKYWTRDPAIQQPGEYVFYLAPDHKTLTPVATDLKKPNGIIGTPDGKTLYVSDIGAKQTFAYAIQPDGTLTRKTLFCSLGSDGMTIDSDGNVYLTGKGVSIFSPAGNLIGHIDISDSWTANIAFGGKERHTLLITASKSVYTLRMRTHGVGSQ